MAVRFTSAVNIGVNYLSFALLAASAIISNILIASLWGVDSLGVFNQVMAMFIVVAQLSVAGQQNAMLHAASQHADVPERAGNVIWVALSVSVLASLLAGFLVLLLSGTIATVLDSPDVAFGLRIVSIGLVFNAVVKVGMQTLNGLGRVHAYAVVQGARPVFVLIGFLFGAILQVEAVWLPAIVVLAEFATMVTCVILLPLQRPSDVRSLAANVVPMAVFGIKSAPAGLLGELNSRVDYLVLGIFANDTVVGIYSFASALAEGMFLATVVLRILLNTQIADLVKQGNPTSFRQFAAKWKMRSALFALCIYTLVLAAYWLLPDMLSLPRSLSDGLAYFAIIGFGVWLASPYTPFGNMLLLAGRPGMHSAYFAALVIFNLMGNFVLTPLFGAIGTAAATSVAYALSAVVLVAISRRALRLPL